jgi:3'-phosphoadenosine 5'-phosphosulfate (PAPS) 3'-phosphatase
MNLQHLCKDVCTLAKTTGVYIKSERLKLESLTIETKSHNSLVTHADKASEQQI